MDGVLAVMSSTYTEAFGVVLPDDRAGARFIYGLPTVPAASALVFLVGGLALGGLAAAPAAPADRVPRGLTAWNRPPVAPKGLC